MVSALAGELKSMRSGIVALGVMKPEMLMDDPGISPLEAIPSLETFLFVSRSAILR